MRRFVLLCLPALGLLACHSEIGDTPGGDAGAGTIIPSDCARCHGDATSSAPPTDLAGRSDPTLRGVGAHRAHLTAGPLSRAMPCGSCHVIPLHVDDPGHMDTSRPAEVVFSGLAVPPDATPELLLSDPAADDAAAVLSCSTTYCHGATLGGGVATVPDWNRPDAKWSACGACHGLPPPPPHAAATDCGACHTATMNAGAPGVIAFPEKHVNGIVELEGPSASACNGCHGSDQNSAPPKDTRGGTSTALVSVGAHQTHLNATLGMAVACTECHPVPSSVGAPGHDDGTTQLVFGPLAAKGATPAWSASAASCATTYCHGATLGGGQLKTPVWNELDPKWKACDACHGTPPPAPHPASADCGNCHTATMGSGAGMVIAHPEKHVNGTVETGGSSGGTTCSTCHGSDANAAPPKDTHGATATTARGVGAHQVHLGATLGKPVACEECHPVPATVGAAGHQDGAIQVTFGALAAKNTAPVWNATAATCASTWCHGAKLVGGAHQTPTWTQVDGTQDTCGSCHGLSPKTGKHPSNFSDHAYMAKDCTRCHAGETDTAGSTILTPEIHVDGTVQVKLKSGTWNASSRSCQPGCHGSESW